MSEEQVRELAERLKRADEEQHEDGAAPADPYEALAREALAWHREQNAKALRPGGLLEVPRGTLASPVLADCERSALHWLRQHRTDGAWQTTPEFMIDCLEQVLQGAACPVRRCACGVGPATPGPLTRPALSDEELARRLARAFYEVGSLALPRDLGDPGPAWRAAARRARELLPAPGDPEQAPVTPPEPAAAPEATQVAGEPVDAATAATEGWRGKRWKRSGSSYPAIYTEDDELVGAVAARGHGLPAGRSLADYVIRLHNSSLDRSAALPRERLASRWAELRADKEQLSRTVNFLVDRLAALQPEARETARLLAQTAIERDELWRRCKWAAGALWDYPLTQVQDVLHGEQPVPGGEEGQDG